MKDINQKLKELEQELKALPFKITLADKFLKAVILARLDYNLIDFDSYLKGGR